MSDAIKTNQQIDGRAAAALCAEAGMEWDEAQRLTAILRKAGVLRSAIGVRAVRVREKLNEEPYIELDFENGRTLAGSLCNDLGLLMPPNPFMSQGPS